MLCPEHSSSLTEARAPKRRPQAALHSRITSQTDVLAIETERMIDGLAGAIDRRFVTVINGIVEKIAAIANSPRFAGRFGMADQIKRLLAHAMLATRSEMLDHFNRLAAWRQRQAPRAAR